MTRRLYDAPPDGASAPRVGPAPGRGSYSCRKKRRSSALRLRWARRFAVASKLSLREAPCAAELQLDPLLAGHAHVPQLRPLPKFPSVRRDLSLIVPETLPFAQIESLVNGLSLDQLESMEYVTTYRGKPLEKGSKSVTITLVFRSPSTTLTSEQVEGAVQKAILAAREKLGATLRM